MRKTIPLLDQWRIKSFTPGETWGDQWRQAVYDTQPEHWLAATVPASVQEVLWAHDKLDKTVLDTGDARETLWVSELDWAFRRTFSLKAQGRVFLSFKGLDAVVDIVINGQLLMRHLSMFLPVEIEITGKLIEENELLLYFYAPQKVRAWMDACVHDGERPRLSGMSYYRKAHGDFSSHAGVIPYFTPIGVYDDIELVLVPEARLDHVDVQTSFTTDFAKAFIKINTTVTSAFKDARLFVDAVLLDPFGKQVVTAQSLQGEQLILNVKQPELWWPRNYGGQPLYTLQVSLMSSGEVVDRDEKRLGLREIVPVGPLQFAVNGVRVRLWGSCITPMFGPSHRYIPERAQTLLDHAQRANINALRIWGPSQQYNDRFYEETDRRGILIWQDFPISGSHLPEDQDYLEITLSEARAMVLRLKHHASILLWCGCNETVYMCDLFGKEETKRLGHDLIYYHFRDVVNSLDPQRVYRASSPIGGVYPNDPHIDTHGSRAALSFVPGEDYANFFSENIRTFIPELKSVQRFLPGNLLWDGKWKDGAVFGADSPLPPAWHARTINHWSEKAGPYERFYEATDAQSLIYKYNAAAAHDIRLILHNSRRGKPFYRSEGDRMTNGHLIWKLCTAWPQIYCSYIDYFLEPGQPYYALKRAYSPLLVSIDVQDHVYVWGVNDTCKDFHGQVELSVYDLCSQKMFAKKTYAAAVISGASQILFNLDEIGQFWRTCVLFARMMDEQGHEISRDFVYMKAERFLPFPDAKLTLKLDTDGSISITANKFARCVELSGVKDGDAFGWYFEDNWFDLMPGETRCIAVYGRHDYGEITAKAQYSSEYTTIPYLRR